MSLKGSRASSKLLICIENWNLSVSGTNPADKRVCSQCSYPAMIMFCKLKLGIDLYNASRPFNFSRVVHLQLQEVD